MSSPSVSTSQPSRVVSADPVNAEFLRAALVLGPGAHDLLDGTVEVGCFLLGHVFAGEGRRGVELLDVAWPLVTGGSRRLGAGQYRTGE
jgi:hypothetical protein